MSEHLSALQLDEQATGALADPHLATCPECTEKLDALKKQNAAFLARKDAKAFEAQLLDAQVMAAPPSRLMRVALMIAPLAAALLVFFLWPRTEPVQSDQVKGAPMVMLLDAKGDVVTAAKVGDKLSLALRFSGSEPREVTVSAVDASGKREELWKGTVAPNERAVISKVVVTPGDVEITADFAPPASQGLRVGARRDSATTRLEVRGQ